MARARKRASTTRLFNVRSGYQIAGFRLNAFLDRNSLDSKFPQFLAGQSESVQDSTGHDVGFGAQHNLPFHGQFFANYDRASADTNYFSNSGQVSNTSSYTDDIVNAGASFHPVQKLTLNVTENYTSNLNGYLSQSLGGNNGSVLGLSLGSGAHSSTVGGGATYQFTNFLSASSQATYYDQTYFGKNYTGTYVSGTVNYGKRLLDMFTFSGSVIDSDNGQGTNALGFIGNVNFFHRIKGWQTSGVFSYAQNVQSLAGYLYDLLLQLQREPTPPFAGRAAVDSSLQRNPQRFDQLPGNQQSQRRLLDGVRFAEVHPQRQLHPVERPLAVGRERVGAGVRDAGSE